MTDIISRIMELTSVPSLSFALFSFYDIDSKKIVSSILKYSLLFSSAIELGQLFLRWGTFQLSDIAQNTFGGIIGAILYLAIQKLKNAMLIFRDERKKKNRSH